MAKGCTCDLQHCRQRHPFQRPGSSRALLLVDQRLVDDAAEARIVSCKGDKYLRAHGIGLVVHGRGLATSFNDHFADLVLRHHGDVLANLSETAGDERGPGRQFSEPIPCGVPTPRGRREFQ